MLNFFYTVSIIFLIRTVYQYFKGENMLEQDLSFAEYYEYDFQDRVYRIDKPVKVFIDKATGTHKVLDKDNVVHVVPSPGSSGCVLKFKATDVTKPLGV